MEVYLDETSDSLFYIDGAGKRRYLRGTRASDLAAVTAASGAAARQVVIYTASETPASVAANTSNNESVTVTGVLTTDYLLAVIGPSSNTAGLVQGGARISANDTVIVEFINTTAGAISPAAGTYTFVVLR
jgi:hypothetical protein